MSFDIYLMRFEHGREAAADRDAVADVFRELGAGGPDGTDRYELPIDDLWQSSSALNDVVTEVTVMDDEGPGGGHERERYRVDVNAGGLDGGEEFTGCSFFLRAFSPGIARVVFRIAEAGRLTIIAVSDGSPLLPPSVGPSHLPEDDYFVDHRRVTSGDELYAALIGQHDRYRRWHDRALDQAASAGSRLDRRIYRWARAFLRFG